MPWNQGASAQHTAALRSAGALPCFDQFAAGAIQRHHRVVQFMLGVQAALDRVHMPGQLDLQRLDLAERRTVGPLLGGFHNFTGMQFWMRLATVAVTA